MKKLNVDDKFALSITSGAVFLLLLILGYLFLIKKPLPKPISKPIIVTSYDSIPVTITTYQPIKEQCGNNHAKTFTGDKIKKKHNFSWVAVSQDLLDYHLNFDDTIRLITKDNSLERISGTYIVKDKTSNSLYKTIDILSLNKFNFKCKGYILKKLNYGK